MFPECGEKIRCVEQCCTEEVEEGSLLEKREGGLWRTWWGGGAVPRVGNSSNLALLLDEVEIDLLLLVLGETGMRGLRK